MGGTEVESTRKPFPGFAALYELSDPPPYPGQRGTLAVDDYEDLVGLLRGERTPPQPLVVWLDGDASPDDVIWLRSVAGAIVHQRVVDVFRSEGFTGWTTYPVEAFDEVGTSVPGYHGLAVTGRCGALDWSRSRRLVEADEAHPYVLCQGCYFDPNTWDSSDLFLWEPFPGFHLFADFPFVTGAVRRVLERMRVGNVWLRRLTEIEMYIPAEELSSA